MKAIQKMKEKNGITLVALVITIVVLIILAGVAINMTLGENGVFKKAKKAKEDYQTAATNEEEALKEIDIDSMTGKNTEPYANPYIPTGFAHTQGSWNSGYTIKGTTQSTDNEFVWVPCVLTQTAKSTEDGVVTFEKITTGKYNSNNLGLLPTDTTVAAEDSSVDEIRTSVGKYGGFYIAKYEAGVEGTTESTKTNDVNKQTQDGTVKPVSKPNVGVWNFITRANAIVVSKAMADKTVTGVSSTLISGEAWDTTLTWITKTDSVYAENSTGKGNYTANIATTASNIAYAINNIYDMAGNIYEWTTENCTSNDIVYSVIRGGRYGLSVLNNPAAHRYNYNGSAGNIIGFRVVLYK